MKKMKKNEVFVIFSAFFIFFIGFVAIPQTLYAATFNVSSRDTGGLIDAINDANGNGEDDTINLENGTYTLVSVDNSENGANGLPLITSKITIRGVGAAITTIERDDAVSTPAFRIFHVGSGGVLTLEDVTVKNGDVRLGSFDNNAGGGILNRGMMNLINCIISYNSAFQAGGIMNEGTMTLTNCTISSNDADGGAGGIENGFAATSTLTNCTISGNSGGYAPMAPAGINNNSTMTLTNCTISDNSDEGIATHGTMTLTNCTISDNSRWGIESGGTTTLTNCTISGNGADGGGGIRSASFIGKRTELKNSIVANNLSSGDCGGSEITSLDYNLDSDGTCNLTQPNDLTNPNPLLGSLADNGGPTQTRALLSGSPAIDKGNNSNCPIADQRGRPRPDDGDGDGDAVCDIGAYEFSFGPQLAVSPTMLDFDSVQVGMIKTLSTTIRNIGGSDVTVGEIDTTGSSDFALSPLAPVTPLIVAPMDSIDLPIDYMPSTGGDDVGALEIASDDPNQPVVSVTLSGTGEISEDGLVAAYGFEGQADDLVVVDVSGNGNDGLISGAARTTEGWFGNALAFDGRNDWVTIADADSLDLTTGMTLEAWVYPTALGYKWRTVLLKEQPDGLVYALYANSDHKKPVASVHVNEADQNLYGDRKVRRNQWTHLAATYDGDIQRLYVDGEEVAYEYLSGAIKVSDGVLRIGGNNSWLDEFFKGRIDEVRVYDRALTAGEIQADMQTPVIR